MIVNLAYVESLIAPIIGGADNDIMCAKYGGIDASDEKAMRQMIKHEILPQFELMGKDYQKKAKHALAHSLVFDSLNFKSLFDNGLVAFGYGENVKAFFVWLWQELFHDEPIDIDGLVRDAHIFDWNEIIKH